MALFCKTQAGLQTWQSIKIEWRMIKQCQIIIKSTTSLPNITAVTWWCRSEHANQLYMYSDSFNDLLDGWMERSYAHNLYSMAKANKETASDNLPRIVLIANNSIATEPSALNWWHLESNTFLALNMSAQTGFCGLSGIKWNWLNLKSLFFLDLLSTWSQLQNLKEGYPVLGFV